MERVAHAKIPILKLRHLESNYKFDISFNIKDGVKSSKRVRRYLERFTEAKYLLVFFKAFLSQRRLHETFSGGINTFVLFNLVISYLQHSEAYSRNSSPGQTSLGTHIMDLLRLYSLDFNYQSLGISIDDACYYLKREKGFFNRDKPKLMSIEHKVNGESIDIGAPSYNFDLIRKSFENAFKVLLAWTPCHTRTPLGLILRLSPYYEDRIR